MKRLFYSLLFSAAGFAALAQNTPAPVANISTPEYQEYAPTLSADGKTMVFQSNREGGFRLYESMQGADGKWSTPTPIEAINRAGKPGYLIGGPNLSADGMSLYFCARLSDTYGDMDIYVSQRKKDNTWGKPDNIGRPVNSLNNESFPAISADGKKLFFTTTMITTGKDTVKKCPKIMMSELDNAGKWQKPVELAAPVNASCGDKAPRFVYDNKVLIFSSNKNGNYDLYRTELSGANTWTEPVALSFVNSGEQELYASLIPHEYLIYYTSKGDIYSADVPDDFRLHGLGLFGKTTDAETNKPVEASVYVIDTLLRDTIKIVNTVNAAYKINVPAGKKYRLLARADQFYDYTQEYTPGIDEPFKKMESNIPLRPKRREVVFKVADSETNKRLKVKIKVTNVATKEETILEANAGRDGQYAINLREGNKYNVEISSIEGYAFTSTTIDVPSSPLYASNTPVINDSLSSDAILSDIDIKLQPLKDDTKLVLNDIYFQSNKFQLEEESYKELERVVTLMKTNPSAIVEISAHTDDVGADDFNLKLSEKRAQEIVKYLNSRGVATKKLRARGYGETRPVQVGETEEIRARNRRVELKILDIK